MMEEEEAQVWGFKKGFRIRVSYIFHWASV